MDTKEKTFQIPLRDPKTDVNINEGNKKVPQSSPESPQTAFDFEHRRNLWKKIQSWYLIGFLVTVIITLQNINYNCSSVIMFLKQDSQNGQNFFLAIKLFLLLNLSSHLAYTFLTGQARKKDSWPTKKSSMTCYLFLTIYETFTLIFVAIFCLQEDKFFNWLDLHEVPENHKVSLHTLQEIHNIEMQEACCGFNDYRDYFQHKEYLVFDKDIPIRYSVPPSCCASLPCKKLSEDPRNLTINRNGCVSKIIKFTRKYLVMTSLSLFILASIQAIITALSFKVRRSYYYEYKEPENNEPRTGGALDQLPSSNI